MNKTNINKKKEKFDPKTLNPFDKVDELSDQQTMFCCSGRLAIHILDKFGLKED